MSRYICIHGHFYQPPRENPWLEQIELQDSAYPYHDWNERITAECYSPNTASRILDSERRIIDIVNNYARISFNFGPTLLSWMAEHQPEVYQMIIDSDKESQKLFSGHGSALAQVYNHLIMPLANQRDKRTQIIWGIKDFEYRFGRKPEGMWLAETAVDSETLDILAEQEIKFTILAPKQANRVRKIGDKRWKSVSAGRIDPKNPYLLRLKSGRTINILFYDGPIAHDIAFGELLKSGESLANRMLGAFSNNQEQPELVHIATDGETYGHHHRYGEMALAYCLYHIESKKLAKLTIYGEYLEKFPPTHEVEIIENSSWSCIHGIERWKNDCGCNSGLHPGWHQKWRASLRQAMDWLRDALIPIYETEAVKYLKDPWLARDDYITVILDRSSQNVEKFLAAHTLRELSKDEKVKVLRLLEMQRHSMLMYTSCGWFFDEISGIETSQVMQYAARAMQLAYEVSSQSLENEYKKILETAPSNIEELKNGAIIYERHVIPAIVDPLRVVAHYAISSFFKQYPETIKIYCYTANKENYDYLEAGIQKMAIGKVLVRSEITWREDLITFAVLHFADHNIIGGVKEFISNESFAQFGEEIKQTFMKSDIPEVIRLMDNYFGSHNYSLWHLFRDEQREILHSILASSLQETEVSFRQIFERRYPIMRVMQDLKIPLPKAVAVPFEFILNLDIQRELESKEPDLTKIENLVKEIKELSLESDKITLAFIAGKKIEDLMKQFSKQPGDVQKLETILKFFQIIRKLNLDLNLWQAQNIYFSIGKRLYIAMRGSAEKGDQNAKKWFEYFNNLSNYLYVKLYDNYLGSG